MSYRFAAYSLPHHTVDPHVAVEAQLPAQDWSLEDQSERGRSTLNLSLPASDRPLLNSLLFIDPDDHTNDIGTIIHTYVDGYVDSAGDPAPVLSFFLERRADRLQEPATETVDLQAGHLLTIFDHSIVYPFDWNRYPTIEGDWMYGADSILDNGDFESANTLNEIQSIIINEDVDGGTWEASFKGDTATGLAWDINTGTLQTELISAFTTVIGLSVSGAGEADDPFLIEFTDPGEANEPQMSVDGSGLTGSGGITGAAIEVDTTQTGGTPGIGNWTKSIDLRTGRLHGTYASGSNGFGITGTQFRSPDYSLRVNGTSIYAGAQQVVNVVSGMRYVASVWVWTASATDRFRLVIRDRFESLVAWTTPIEQSVPPSTWTEFSVQFVAPMTTTQLVFRFAVVSEGNPSPFFLDDAALTPGAPPATMGTIWWEQLDDLRVDHVIGEGRELLTWITPTFTTTTDSAGNPWPGVHSLTINEGNTHLQLMEHHRSQYGYEFDLRYDQDDDEFYFDIFNPGAGGTAHPANHPAIVVGPGVTGGDAMRSVPDGTILFLRGSNGLWRESSTFAGYTYWGRRERYVSAQDAHSDEDIAAMEDHEKDKVEADTLGLQFSMADVGQSIPMVDFRAADYLTVTPGEDTGISTGARRVETIKVAGRGGQVTSIDVHVGSEVFGSLGFAAQAEAVRRLLRHMRFVQPETGGSLPLNLGGGGIPDVVLAAADTGFLDTADLLSHQFDNDGAMMNEALANLASRNGGWIHCLEGEYVVSEEVLNTLSRVVKFTGAGREQTVIKVASGANISAVFRVGGGFVAAGGFTFEDLTIDGNKGLATVTDVVHFSGGSQAQIHFTRVRVENGSGNGINIQRPGGISLARLTDSESVNNGGWGLIAYEVNLKAVDCSFSDNGSDGVIVGFGGKRTLIGCDINSNGGNGVDNSGLSGGTGEATLIGNNVNNNTADGIDLAHFNGTPSVIVGNHVQNNGGKGIAAMPGSQVGLNLVDGNGDDVVDPPQIGTDQQQVVPWSQIGTLAITVGSHKYVLPDDIVIVSARAAVGTAPSGADVVVDVNVNGTSVYNPPGDPQPSVPDGSTVGTVAPPAAGLRLASAGDYITVDIDQVGSSVTGEDLTVMVELLWLTG